MATPIKSAFAKYDPILRTSRTPTQKLRYDTFVRTKDDFRPIPKDPLESKGYMVFEGFDEPMSEDAHAAYLDELDAFEEERQQQLEALEEANRQGISLMEFHSANPGWNEYKPWKTAGVQRAAAREEAYNQRQIEKERRQEEQMKALIKHRSVVKQMNLQQVAGTKSQVAATRQKAEDKKFAEQERVRIADQILIDEVAERDRIQYEEYQERVRKANARKARRAKEVVLNVYPSGQALTQDDLEMVDILNELQRPD